MGDLKERLTNYKSIGLVGWHFMLPASKQDEAKVRQRGTNTHRTGSQSDEDPEGRTQDAESANARLGPPSMIKEVKTKLAATVLDLAPLRNDKHKSRQVKTQ